MDKTFETLYAIAMLMADNCLTDQTIDARFTKLEEEYQELVEAFDTLNKYEVFSEDEFAFGKNHASHLHAMKGEMADVLFVLLHTAYKFNWSAKDLLHMAATKMFARLNDPTYVAKEQRKAEHGVM